MNQVESHIDRAAGLDLMCKTAERETRLWNREE